MINVVIPGRAWREPRNDGGAKTKAPPTGPGRGAFEFWRSAGTSVVRTLRRR